MQCVIGMWQFSARVPRKTLITIAEQWAAQEPAYRQLYVRRISDTRVGIGFIYQAPPESFERYLQGTSQYFKNRFGQLFAGWDICSNAELIK